MVQEGVGEKEIDFQFPEIKESETKKEKWKLKDFHGFVHMHSWEGSSCGREKIEDIVDAMKKKTGLEYIGFAEHVGWPNEEYWTEKILAEFDNIDRIQKEHPEIKIFKGIEANILQDGTIDADLELLKRSDIVVASHHYRNIESPSESTAEVTIERWFKVMDNYPEVNELGHPLRDLPEAEWPKIDWDKVCQKAKEKNVIIEVGISDSAVDKLPDEFLQALAKNGNLVMIAPDFHHLTSPSKKDDWFGHRWEDLTSEQRSILERYHQLKGKIAGKTFKEGETLKGRKIDEKPLTKDEEAELIRQLKEERAELSQIEKSDALKEIYEILLLSEKETLLNGKTIEKFPLSISTLLRFGRRINRVRKAGVKAENLVNLWSKEKLEEWIEQRKNSLAK